MATAKRVEGEEKNLKELFAPHISSFNFLLNDGVKYAVRDIPPMDIPFAAESGNGVTVWFEDAHFDAPCRLPDSGTPSDSMLSVPMYPRECRESGISYAAPFYVTMCIQEFGMGVERIQQFAGAVPIMVQSNRCRLHGLSPSQLVERGEEEYENGGYFICNGLEKLIRMIIVQRRNYPLGVKRKAYQKRGGEYSDMGVSIRCVRPDQTSQTVTLHYLTDGGCTLRFLLRKSEFFVPGVLLLKTLVDTTDREIYDRLTQLDPENTFVTERVVQAIADAKKFGVVSSEQGLAFLGKKFRQTLRAPTRFSDVEVGELLIKRHIFVHLNDKRAKFDLLILMMQKLYALASGDIQAENPDSPMNQEVLLGGHLYLGILKEKIQEWMDLTKKIVQKDVRRKGEKFTFTKGYFCDLAAKSVDHVSRKMRYFLATGNVVSNTGLDLMQVSGYCLLADKLNFHRYLSHFFCVHRGSFFATMKTTDVRKLLPDSWGFLCPVHTPDGSPCGLLNHLSAACRITDCAPPGTRKAIKTALSGMGMEPSEYFSTFGKNACLPVILDGEVVGYVSQKLAEEVEKQLRVRKVMHVKGTVFNMEIALIKNFDFGLFPGLYIMTGAARFSRPVRNLGCEGTEWVGSFEQGFLDIAVKAEEINPRVHTHMEITPMNILSVNAALTPFSDFNQSPRNMYQCQMGKQTMATPCHSLPFRSDNKLYKLQTPQIPNVMTESNADYCMHDYPQGTNAIIAVISYTAYDMEDACILNKGSYERGFGHASVYTAVTYDLSEAKSDPRDEVIQAYVIEAFEATNAGELSVSEGEMVKVFDKSFGSSPTSNVMSYTTRKTGTVPCSHMQIIRMGERLVATRDVINSVGELVLVKGEVVDLIREVSPLEYEVFVPTSNVSITVSKGHLGPLEMAQKDMKYFDNRVRGTNVPYEKKLDEDGLPYLGTYLESGSPLYCYYDEENHGHRMVKYKKMEPCRVEGVTILGRERGQGVTKVCFKLRYNRNPIIGDKFSSRHGQKGVCSQQWPQENMPFTESGLTPDIIINPHAFPSRMTIGMLVETMAAKAGMLHGVWQDATPFKFSEKHRAVDFFGEQLAAAGYNYYGNEPMYSGASGEEFESQIFFGVVYYQRLRHMVSDKYQVRSTGPNNSLTRQPIKGRKKGGGIRFGEMERDSLLAHGVSYMLRDRLMKCSDYDESYVCTVCGSILTTLTRSGHTYCRVCPDAPVSLITLPHVFRYMTAELAAMNINVTIQTK